MLKSAFTSPKIRMLAARLGVPFPHAVGVCGLVWNFTADHAPRGDIGKHGDFEIAAAAEWHGDPAGFVEAMVSCRLLDRDDEFRLLVRGSISLNKRLDRIRHRLGWLDGPYEERNG